MLSLKDRIIKWWHTSSGTKFVRGKAAYVYLYKNKYHREDGPAILYDDGSYEHIINGRHHREDGPAIFIYENGCPYKEMWFSNGQIHRLDGPAITNYYSKILNFPESSSKLWYYKDKLFNCKSQKEFEKMIKLLVFI